jgi:ApaG protein
MEQQVSQGIKISVEPSFSEERSVPGNGNYLFTYTINIKNLNDDPVMLLRRRWFIFDALNDHSEVEGPGVVGLTPSLQHGESFKYTSACVLLGEFGSMTGYYVFRNMKTGVEFAVQIPKFNLTVPWILN